MNPLTHPSPFNRLLQAGHDALESIHAMDGLHSARVAGTKVIAYATVLLETDPDTQGRAFNTFTGPDLKAAPRLGELLDAYRAGLMRLYARSFPEAG